MTQVQSHPVTDSGVSLIAHLLRRAGLGASADELGSWCARGYQDAVETLLNPVPDATPYGNCADDDLITRYLVAAAGAQQHDHGSPAWAWRLYTSPRPLEEKIALFWHGLFATGGTKYPMHASSPRSRCSVVSGWVASSACCWSSRAIRRCWCGWTTSTTTGTRPTRTTAGSCSSCFRWAGGTTPRTT